ncbi:calcineurin-like phosphoesterase C-terminal domain-containing protein [Pseudoxanthomonas sp. LH2527]|uniref:calcineurin-like phosphoesterase C-terminal domain-containing protein n=1 Tax=Pseudoxanthomonas sp. LH2527 TaxID=2923249 RepID=UPI001F12C22E|nr:calcineurin-like phosphoesterase C-terminal domain-containing protein [Pseudoxanthomonas sp. LH2527]MCH6484343.1 calcineurin-like phosphoesterase C-terminal domain-containing protein [Pseudoxanthomonas sp. LH2527]
MRAPLIAVLLALLTVPAHALPPPCSSGQVFEDRNGNGVRDAGEPGIPGVKVSDGVRLSTTDANGGYDVPYEDGRTLFVIKPAGYDLSMRPDGMPDFWHNRQYHAGPALKFGGIPQRQPGCRDFALRPRVAAADDGAFEALLLADSQTSSLQDVDYYWRDIVQPLVGQHGASLGLTLGDIVNDDLSLYPAMLRTTMSLQVPWLFVPGNHDLDFDAAGDEDSLRTFRHHLGPDTFAWEEDALTFIGLDDIIYQPGKSPSYVGGLREDQFAFLQAYLPTVRKDRLLVIGVHIPFFEEGARGFRAADRERLFALLADFPHVLLLSGHTHTQRHWYHDAATGWHGAQPLHEYNVGAACGAYWSGVKDAQGIPVSTMADGTPNGYARLRVNAGGDYALSWHPARASGDSGIGLHAPKVLRKGAYPAWGVYANVYMGEADTRVEYRIDGGEWKAMKRVEQPDPSLLVENMRDDLADALRGYDRSPEAEPSHHLWRGALPTDLAEGEHRIEVRAFDRWRGETTAHTTYRLQHAEP